MNPETLLLKYGNLPVISIKQPWAHFIIHGHPVAGIKDVENRTRYLNYRGKMFIHAAMQPEKYWQENMSRMFEGVQVDFCEKPLNYGGIIGIVEMIDCVRQYPSHWSAPGHYKYVLKNHAPVRFTRVKGQQGIFYLKPKNSKK